MTHPAIVHAWRSGNSVRAIVHDERETELVLYPDAAYEVDLAEVRGLSVVQARELRFRQSIPKPPSMVGEDRHTTTVDGAAAHAAHMHRNPLTGLYW